MRVAVMGVAGGQAVFGPGVAARVLDRMTGRSGRDDTLPELTPREHEVLTHLVDGCEPATIAHRMGIADKTVRNNISSVLTKLHVADRAAAIDQARRAGIGRHRAGDARYVVFVEMDGPTRVARELGDAYAATLAAYDRLVVAAMRKRGGVCFGRAGAAQFAWFRDSLVAVRSCADVHRRLAGHAFPTGVEIAARTGPARCESSLATLPPRSSRVNRPTAWRVRSPAAGKGIRRWALHRHFASAAHTASEKMLRRKVKLVRSLFGVIWALIDTVVDRVPSALAAMNCV